VKQHPAHRLAPYAYYLKALCYYDQITDVGRDQKITEEARQALREVVSRYPDSEYARDARLKLDLVADHLAGKEMEIGRWYERHQEWLAAINRFRVVVENYQTTSHTPEALERLVECYLKLGVTDQAQHYAAVLGYNYPSSIWYKNAYAQMNGKALPSPESTSDEPPSWWHRLWPF
jgi:outer membrane protein assembly factor BamD